MEITPSEHRTAASGGAADEAIHRAFAARETWALEAFYVRHANVLYSAAYSVLRDANEAKDCVHDVLLRVWRRPNSFTAEKGTLRAFVTVAIRNEAVSRIRLRAREPALRERLARQTHSETFEPFDHVEHTRLTAAIRALPDVQQEVIALSYFGYLTLREIADRTGEPIGTIKSRLSAALRRLHTALSEDPSDA